MSMLFFAAFAVSSQTLYTTKRDSVPAQSDFFTLKTNQYRGLIQWQQSLDGQSWTNLTGATNSELVIPASTEAFYRAKLTDGNCFETYTDSAVVLKHKIQNTTLDPNAIAGAILLRKEGSTYVYKNIGNIQIPKGTLLVTNDSASNVQVVSSAIQKHDTLNVNTIQGSMTDIFLNKSFKLTTAANNNVQNAKGMTRMQQSGSLIDDNGFIHPVSIINNKATSQKIKNTDINGSVPLVSFDSDISGEKLYDGSVVSVECSEGYFKFNSELKCEFDFEQPHFDLGNLKFNAGSLRRMSFYTDPDVTGVDAKLVLKAIAGGKEDFEKEIKIKEKIFDKSFKFAVGNVPVWMDVTMDLMAKVSGSISSELSVSAGATASARASFGLTYENGKWSTINTLTKSFSLIAPEVTGRASEELRVEVYPHIDVKFYKVFGPWLQIKPYVSQEMNVSITGNSDFQLYGGTDVALGINAIAFDKEVAGYETEFNLKNELLYQTPCKLKLLSGDNQLGEAGVALADTIVLQVLDSNDKPVVNYPVNLQTLTGNTFNSVINTDSNGKVNVKWTLDETEGEQRLEAYLENGKDEKIATADTIVKANSKSKIPTVTTTAVSDINETSATCGGTVTKNGGATVTARGVCWNTIGTPTIADNKTTDGSGDGAFSSKISGLTIGTTYFVRAYATNKNGTAYGEVFTFTTEPLSTEIEIEAPAIEFSVGGPSSAVNSQKVSTLEYVWLDKTVDIKSKLQEELAKNNLTLDKVKDLFVKNSAIELMSAVTGTLYLGNVRLYLDGVRVAQGLGVVSAISKNIVLYFNSPYSIFYSLGKGSVRMMISSDMPKPTIKLDMKLKNTYLSRISL